MASAATNLRSVPGAVGAFIRPRWIVQSHASTEASSAGGSNLDLVSRFPRIELRRLERNIMAHKFGSWCGSAEHGLSRRGFLGASAVAGAAALGADMTVLNILKEPALAEEIKR